MSVGQLRESETKRGVGCKLCDVIINDEVAEEVKKDSQMQQFFLQLRITFTCLIYINIQCSRTCFKNLKLNVKICFL